MKLPKLSDEFKEKSVFTNQFEHFIVYNYLFEGKQIGEIEDAFFDNGIKYDGSLALKVLKKYCLISKATDTFNKGLYKGENVSEVVKELNKLNDKKAKRLAGLLMQTEQDVNANLQEDENDNELPVLSNRTDDIYPLNLILYGAPGTGKTYSTAEYSVGIIENYDIAKKKLNRETINEKYRKYLDSGQIVFTTFHQNYGYEEFIQGLRPNTSSNELSFKIIDGVFKNIADKALNDSSNNYVIIIDEINRGNISRIFGELITLIEDDKRWGEKNQMFATLPYGKRFTVPNNLYIVGTMNSADKSISLVDTALRRRFNFVEKTPELELIKDTDLKNVLSFLNNNIIAQLRSADLVIGHSFFIDKTVKDLDVIMNEHIIPLLYEYFFEDDIKVRKVLDAVTSIHYEEIVNGKKTTFVYEPYRPTFGRWKVQVKKKVGVNVK